MAKYDIFISYRREGGFHTAKHLYDLLTHDGYKVSFDIDTLRNGDFDTSLFNRIDQCKDFILIVDPHAFDRTLNPNFSPSNDWMRQELAYALKRGKNVVPIFLNGANGFPEGLPNDIKAVVKKNGPMYNQYYFDDFYAQLKKRFLHSKGMTAAIKTAIWVAAIAVVCLIGLSVYFYRPVEMDFHPIDEFEDDIIVGLPVDLNKDITDDVEDYMTADVLFAYCNDEVIENNALLVVEDYDDYSPEELGVESYSELESLLETVGKMTEPLFENYYIKAVCAQDTRLKHLGSPRRVDKSMQVWHMFHFQSDDVDQYNAVVRHTPLVHVIFSMKFKKGNTAENYRHRVVFDRTINAMIPKINEYLSEL